MTWRVLRHSLTFKNPWGKQRSTVMRWTRPVKPTKPVITAPTSTSVASTTIHTFNHSPAAFEAINDSNAPSSACPAMTSTGNKHWASSATEGLMKVTATHMFRNVLGKTPGF